MPSCPLCENVQPDGDGCDVCGHPFPARERIEVSVEPLEDMETTSVDPVKIVADAMEGLETTAVEGIPGDDPSMESIVVICRYCRTPGVPGEAFCAHCGMRMPAVAGPKATGLEVRLCRDCGTPVRGESCPACGVRPSR
jgi:predicted amidophosphoribosyltransferase